MGEGNKMKKYAQIQMVGEDWTEYLFYNDKDDAVRDMESWWRYLTCAEKKSHRYSVAEFEYPNDYKERAKDEDFEYEFPTEESYLQECLMAHGYDEIAVAGESV